MTFEQRVLATRDGKSASFDTDGPPTASKARHGIETADEWPARTEPPATGHEPEAFKQALVGSAGMAEDERLIFCNFATDPARAGNREWIPLPRRLDEPLRLNQNANGYICQSSFGRAGDGTYRRLTMNFRQGFGCMVDDIGTKLPLGIMRRLLPSAINETSRGNFQAWYFFREPVRDPARFNVLISAFYKKYASGAKDPGMSGVNRVGRLPGFLNTKSSANNWSVRLRELSPDRRFALDEMADAFGLSLESECVARRHMPPLQEDQQQRMGDFSALLNRMRARGMVKGQRMVRGAGGDHVCVYDVVCPWTGDHTGQVDDGAVLFEPSHENAWWGGFHCFHGHCVDSRGIRELSDWDAKISGEEVERANESASVNLSAGRQA